MVNADHQGADAASSATHTPVLDYFFGDYVAPQQQRLRLVARNGVQHASEITPRDPLPEQPVALAILTDASLPIDRVAVYFTTDGSEPDGRCGTPAPGSQMALAEMTTNDAAAEVALVGATPVRRWQGRLPGQPDGALVRYRIDAWNSGDPAQRWVADASDPFTAPAPAGREFAYHVDRRSAPEWVQDAIVYHIFVDRFATASDQPPLRTSGNLIEFRGGTIRGITEKLAYLSDLGVTCLWLSPVMESPTYHSYNPSSYYDVSRRFGSNADLRELIAAAHARGMRVLLDFVANHTSIEHPAFVEAQRDDAATDTDTANWYTFGSEYCNGYLAFSGVSAMPVLKTDATPVRDYLVVAARHWLTEFGADGVRLDNVSGPAHAFWTFFQEGVKATHPDALTLGEVSGDMSDIATYAGRVDACMDFPLTKQMRRVFAQRVAPLDELLTMLVTHEAAFPARMQRARLLDNHDMHRFLWVAENDTCRLKLALAFLLTLPGFPILYYGTEVGLSQREGPAGKDAFAREPMPWGDDQQSDILAVTRWLIAQRRARVSLRRGRLARMSLTVTSGAADQVGALARWTDGEATLAIFNNGGTPAQWTMDPQAAPFAWQLPDEASAAHQGWLLTPDGVAQLTEPAGAGMTMTGTLPPFSALLLMR